MIIAGRYLIYLEVAVLGLGMLIPITRQISMRALIAATVASGIGWLIKDFFYFPRPFITSGVSPILPYLLDGSVPSNHTAAAVAIAVTIFLYNRRWGMLFFMLGALIATGAPAVLAVSLPCPVPLLVAQVHGLSEDIRTVLVCLIGPAAVRIPIVCRRIELGVVPVIVGPRVPLPNLLAPAFLVLLLEPVLRGAVLSLQRGFTLRPSIFLHPCLLLVRRQALLLLNVGLLPALF